MTNYKIKERAFMLDMTINEVATVVAEGLPQYKIDAKTLSAAINAPVQLLTEKQRMICETADHILREKENRKED